MDNGFFTKIFLQINPKKRKRIAAARDTGQERETLEQLFLGLQC